MHQVIPGTLKPCIRKQWGMWTCGGVTGRTPSEAYQNWIDGGLIKQLYVEHAKRLRDKERDDWLRHQRPFELAPHYRQPIAPYFNPPLGPPWVVTCVTAVPDQMTSTH